MVIGKTIFLMVVEYLHKMEKKNSKGNSDMENLYAKKKLRIKKAKKVMKNINIENIVMIINHIKVKIK